MARVRTGIHELLAEKNATIAALEQRCEELQARARAMRASRIGLLT